MALDIWDPAKFEWCYSIRAEYDIVSVCQWQMAPRRIGPSSPGRRQRSFRVVSRLNSMLEGISSEEFIAGKRPQLEDGNRALKCGCVKISVTVHIKR